ncbi:hypothetical protein WKI68_32805 [Streptomyces sp. MS1.HAVA.3]|uniref:Uncharacterized protein n=1 Tax=Streptomyces caledonius TaxID=3134107 RepID=A0ABU8UA42_9ACTN
MPDFDHGRVCCSKPLPMPLNMIAVLPVPPTSRITSWVAPPDVAGAEEELWEAAGLPPSAAGLGSSLPQPVSSTATAAHSVIPVIVLRMLLLPRSCCLLRVA